MKKRILAALLAAVLLMLSACGGTAQAEKPEARIKRVITRLLTAPDEGTRQFVQGIENGEDPQLLEDTLAAYVAEQYSAEDFAENCFDTLFRQIYSSLIFPTALAAGGKTLAVEEMSVALLSEADRTYTFTAELVLTADGTAQSITQTGRVQTDATGRISSFSLDQSGLLESITGGVAQP